jgi:predicted GIY-YIG superfamily endonuclease
VSGVYFVYFLRDADGTPVYIGRSCNVAARIRAHASDATHPYNPEAARKAAWFCDVRSVDMVGPLTHREACRREREEVERHQPRGNRMFTEAHGWHGRLKLSGGAA